MTWQDVLGVRWHWRPRRAVRVVVATAVTVSIVTPLLLVLVLACLGIGVLWTAVLVATALLFLWIAEKWWIVVDPDNLLLWLKLLPSMWSWAHEEDEAPEAPGARSNPSIEQENWPTRPW